MDRHLFTLRGVIPPVHPMILGLTGGIATGKSTLVRLLQPLWPADWFDADACVHRLLASDPSVGLAVEKAFGPGLRTADGAVRRDQLRPLVFGNPSARARLESILHPAVRQQWTGLAAAARAARRNLVVDIPLLYETQGEAFCDRVVVVAASPATQLQRLTEVRGLEPGMTNAMLASQLPISEKVRRADHVLWNDGSLDALAEQSRFLASVLSSASP